jgi:hypothetical protein
MNLRIELIPCPGCGRTTHYQWVTHPSGEGRPYCPECKGKRKGLPAAAPYLVGLIYRIAPAELFVQQNLSEVTI